MNCTSDFLSIKSFLQVVGSYIPPTILNKTGTERFELNELLKFENDGEKIIQHLYDNSNYQLRMYGSVKELCGNIKIYRNVTSDIQLFAFDRGQPHTTMPILYQGYNLDAYICKQDIFVYISNIILTKSEIMTDIPFCRMILTMFMNLFEQNIYFTLEFVKISDPIFAEIQMKLDEVLQDQTDYVTRTNFPNLFKTYTYDGFDERFKELLPFEFDEETSEQFHLSLVQTIRSFPPALMGKFYEHMFVECHRVTEALHDIFEENPRVFLPYGELADQTKVPKILRIFKDRPHSFVPLNELKALLGEPEHIFKECVWEMIPENEAMDMAKSKLGKNFKDQIEFIQVPVIRAKHRAVFIRDTKGLPYKLAMDVFSEVLYELIVGMKVFQRVKGTELNSVEEMFSHFDKYFQTTRGNVHFIQNQAITIIEAYARNKFEYLSNRPAKDVRNAKKDGFTVQNLKNELVNLGLVNTFPDILDHAEIVYDTIVERTPVLTTTELFEAVVQCQFISFFKKFPKWTKFVHDQKGCDRVMYLECQCRKQSTAAELLAKLPDSIRSDTFIRLVNLRDGSVAETSPKLEATQPSSTSTNKSTKKSVAASVQPTPTPATTPKPKPTVKPTPSLPVKQYAQPPSTSSGKQSAAPSLSSPTSSSNFSSEPSESVTKITKSQRRKEKKKVAKKESQPETPKAEPQPDSENCTECPRANTLCQETKKKLETCEKKLEAAEKEQSDWKKVKREMEMELEKSKQKVVEMEKQMKNMKEQGDKEVEKLKEQAEKLLISNKTEQEKAIAEREDLQKQLSEMMKINEECSNNFRDLSLLSSQKDLAIHKLQRELAAAREPPKERISVEMRRVLADLQDKSHSSCKLVTDTRKKVMRLINLPTTEAVKQMARDEEAVFFLKHTEWEQAIKKNIEIIQSNVHVTQQDLVPVPETPGLSELLENELVIAEKKNESMGKECLVCREEKLQTQKLFKCPHCPTTFHVKCINDWIKYQPKCICPVCKENLN